MLSKEQVKKIAGLSRLSLTEKEVEKFQQELEDTLDYIEVLEELDTEGVCSTSQVTGLEDVFREDEKEDSISQEQALSGTGSRYKDYFKVGAIFK